MSEKNLKSLNFDLPKEQSSIIKVVGVGGGGSNAVNHMHNFGIKGVDFVVCNTDSQALDVSPVPVKIQLGASLTEGRGAGSIPEIGKNAAIENIDDITEILQKNTKMVFVTAGMGGGTGTGAAPVIARAAREEGVLTVGIVTMPFTFEGRKRKQQAEQGLKEMRESVDTLLVINNDRLREMYGNLTLANAFAHADDVLATAAKGIAEVISVTGAINVDFNDVNTVMKDSGVAIMGQAQAEGEDRAIKAVQQALASPLLNDNDIKGATYVLLNITYGDKEVLMDEIADITDYIQEEAGATADVIWGHGYDETLGDNLSITIIATGFNTSPDTGINEEPKKNVMHLEDERPTIITKPVDKPTNTEIPKQEPPSKVEDEPYLKSEEDQESEEKEESPKEQTTFEFEVKSPFDQKETETSSEDSTETESEGGVKRYYLDDEEEEAAQQSSAPKQESVDTEPTASSQSDEESDDEGLSKEEQQERAQERIARIKQMSSKLKSPKDLNDLENEPAYKRRNVKLDDVPHSSESQVSRYTLSEEEDEDGEKKTGLKDNNSFLHDNVD